MKPVKAGLIGSGIISWTYLDNMVNRFESVEVVGCSDLIPERSAARAEEFGIRQMTNQEIYDDPEIEIVVNTTNWQSHTQVIREALNAGKHVYTEKSLAPSYEEACEIARLAEEKGLRIGCAPDTFLGGGYQTCRKLIDDGYISPSACTHFWRAMSGRMAPETTLSWKMEERCPLTWRPTIFTLWFTYSDQFRRWRDSRTRTRLN